MRQRTNSCPSSKISSEMSSFTLSILLLLALLHCTRASLSPNATSFWDSFDPDNAVYDGVNNLVYISSGVLSRSSSPILLAITPSEPHLILANTTLPGGGTDRPVTCGQYVHASATDLSTGQTVVWTWSVSSLVLIGSVEMPYPLIVMGCVEQDEVVLTARPYETMVVAFRASDGKRLAAWQLANMSVRGVAYR